MYVYPGSTDRDYEGMDIQTHIHAYTQCINIIHVHTYMYTYINITHVHIYTHTCMHMFMRTRVYL